jgi:hypothetical protein
VAKKRPASPVIFASGLRADPGRWCARGSAAAGLSSSNYAHLDDARPWRHHTFVARELSPPTPEGIEGQRTVTRPTSADLVDGFPHRSRFWRARCSARLVLSGRTNPQPASCRRFRPLTCLSRCGCLAPEPIQLEALMSRARDRSVSRAIVRLGGTSLTSPHRLALRPAPSSGEEEVLESLQRSHLLSCRSRGARARGSESSFARCSALGSGFAPATSRPFGSRTFRSVRRLGSGSRSRAILPALSSHDVTRSKIPVS